MKDGKNLILAIVLSAIVLFGWGFIAERFIQPAHEPSTEIVEGRQVPVEQPSAHPTLGAAPPTVIRAREEVIAETPRIPIETPRLSGSLNLRGAVIDDLVLTTHRQTIDGRSPPVRLFSPAGSPGAYYGAFGWSGDGLAAPGPDTVWEAQGGRLAPGSPVRLRWNNGQGQLFEILLSVDEGYMFTAEQRVRNAGAGAVAATPFALVNRVGESADPSYWTMHVGPVGIFDGRANYDNDFADVAREERRYSSTGGWLGFTDKYWLAAIVPDQQSTVGAAFRHNAEANSYQAQFTAQPAIVQPGATQSYTSRLFAGAKEVRLLDAYSAELGTELERAIDWGWFRWFMKPIFSLLNWLFAMIGNFGVAIICLTVIVRLLLFPIAQKQFASMAAMRVVQPKMKALQERYKDDKPRLQQEMLKLYREEKVNPMAGCLPILLQIPIFYALYKVLMLSVEMRHEPFILWIQDLSAPDPLTPVNLFGFLPFTPPAFLAVGILPILLGLTMWLQFRLNPAPMDPIQKQVFALMPWILMFIMAPFAAGLQLYWTINNVLTIAQQKLLYARHPALKQQAEAEKARAEPATSPPAPPPPPPPPPPATMTRKAKGKGKGKGRPRSR